MRVGAKLKREEKEQYLVFAEELAKRRAKDPLFLWEPHTKQRVFIESVLGYQIQENWLIAANRAGKSDAGAAAGSKLARFGHPQTGKPTSGWVVALDSKVSNTVIQPKYFDNGLTVNCSHQPFIPDREIQEWRAKEQILILKNGSIIEFKTAESGSRKFQGAGIDWIQFDEEPPYPVYEESTIRVSANKPLIIFGTCTILPPEGSVGGVSWLFPRVIQPFLDGKNPNIKVFGASIYDNPHLSLDEIRRLEAKFPPDSVIGRIRLGGEWLPGLSGARTYVSFDRLLHVRPQDNKFNRNRPIVWALDFNVEPMVSIIGQRDGDIFRVFTELVLDEGNIFKMVDMFRSVYPNHDAEIWIYGDTSGKRRTGQTGMSDYQMIINAMKTYSSPAVLKVPEQNPLVGDRINAVNRLLKDEHGRIRVEIDPSCTELIEDMEQVLRDSKGGIKKTFNRKDPYNRRTHTSDALGYWLCYAEPVGDSSYPVGIYQPIIQIPVPGYIINKDR